ncbi:lipoprotein UxpA [Pseudomonas matsuisoli]|uniref:Lipoprotein UxpA n=1 Tax=Pseudomonas matsuisoli TaxID=1515666 RepID=A0A917Q1L0_9PSED|nr:lipoprotein UxpA [Pseudomonas matsuisoli]GGK07224.1 hypothetical protein GCM10009304_36840 [Pseudomonas matsuisoli]
MGNVGRRQLMGWLAAGAVAPWLAGCASSAASRPSSPGADLSLFYFADTLDAREPGWPVVPRVRLGPARRIGAAPWMTGTDALAASGTRDSRVAPLLDAGQVNSQRYGGYAVLAARLDELRQANGRERSLTLENGQCWNGSGLTYLTQGQAGLAGSQMLGSEARVSSDERVLWPDHCAALYRQFSGPVLGATLDPEGHEKLGTTAYRIIQKQGLNIALVGATDPYANDQPATLAEWFARLDRSVQKARQEADLVIVMADVGTGAGLWLAERLENADLLLCARGQDLWPALIPVARRDGTKLPVCLPGTRGVGFFEIRCQGRDSGWQFTAQFHPALASAVSRPGAMQPYVNELGQARVAHANWLDQRLAQAPGPLWRRDVFGGSWDALIGAALNEGKQTPSLLPGLRYDVPLQRGEWITREHLLALSGGYDAAVLDLQTSRQGLHDLLEEAADQRFSEPLILDNSQDMPRLLNAQWSCRYGAPSGQRISAVDVGGQPESFACRTFTPKGVSGNGEPLWQWIERYLRAQPVQWSVASLPRPQVNFIEGHPGWHPLASGDAASIKGAPQA